MPFAETARACGGTSTRCDGAGSSRPSDEASVHSCAGRNLSASPTVSSRRSGYYTRCPVTASTPEPEGRARCVSSARRDLCGGRGEILVPTATHLSCREPAATVSQVVSSPSSPVVSSTNRRGSQEPEASVRRRLGWSAAGGRPALPLASPPFDRSQGWLFSPLL